MSRAVPRFRRVNALLPLLTTPAYRITAFFLVDQQICLFTCDYIMATNNQTASSEANLNGTWLGATGTPLRALLANDCFLTTTKVQCLTTPSRIPNIYNVAASQQAGTSGSLTHLPSEIAVVMSKQTSTKGQHGRGRMFMPGVPSTFVAPGTDANRIVAAGSTAYGNFATSMFASTIQDGVNTAAPAVTQRVALGAAVLHGQVITTITVRLLLGVIRRRRLGKGK